MNTLAIDTSTNVLGVGVANDEKVIGEYISNIKRNHSTRVLPAIDFLLKDCNMSLNDMEKIVVANGPGSYTGLRIGVTIGKTLAWTLNLPIVGVSSLQLMAASGRYFQGLISPIMDARRDNLFTGLYQYENDQLIQVISDQHISIVEWCELIKTYEKPVLFIGNDVALHREKIATIANEYACFAPITTNIPRPGELALIGSKLENEANIHSFKPNYLRLTEAEAKWREKSDRN
ncbi:tRNA (adenosine(37)-N6)-threonylcarbamoyltransferase complex dimerization subunit type 1 TsaB [Bacillus andreraoultii]|uniref:tRNA (adenosine(37)-N6)-threonylcarbamoyltransferase complex dimerization subunit type 1 TsaB n=1 Tax=Bacillus andreraoultii TaxID=1499685 RepID=UPI000539F4B9|nr:tRNA (adenosine(37)-N6)-threonylcarbamoyltransferase complex dimerization subunit type 1 TsaB [Bacillus andreraoultii]